MKKNKSLFSRINTFMFLSVLCSLFALSSCYDYKQKPVRTYADSYELYTSSFNYNGLYSYGTYNITDSLSTNQVDDDINYIIDGNFSLFEVDNVYITETVVNYTLDYNLVVGGTTIDFDLSASDLINSSSLGIVLNDNYTHFTFDILDFGVLINNDYNGISIVDFGVSCLLTFSGSGVNTISYNYSFHTSNFTYSGIPVGMFFTYTTDSNNHNFDKFIYVNDFSISAYEKGFQDGYNSGFTTGSSSSYVNGYNAGYSDGVESQAEVINQAYNDGYSDGDSYGYLNGYSDGYEYQLPFISEAYNDGYSDGYHNGVTEDETVSSIFSGIIQVGLIPVQFFLSIFDFTILGINITHVIKALLSLAILIVVIRLVLGGKSSD